MNRKRITENFEALQENQRTQLEYTKGNMIRLEQSININADVLSKQIENLNLEVEHTRKMKDKLLELEDIIILGDRVTIILEKISDLIEEIRSIRDTIIETQQGKLGNGLIDKDS